MDEREPGSHAELFAKLRRSARAAGMGFKDDRELISKLREFAGDDPRIELLGFVNDDEVSSLYADALAVPYVPLDEDYGLVTFEAMACGKPVITTHDAGGPLEFVVDG